MSNESISNPLVSVLINNYNYARYLPDAIESVLTQTYKNVEIVVVDDGSLDESRDLIAAYAKRHSTIIPIFQQNGGQAAAYNAAVTKASGEILCFLDSDDVWLPEKIATVVESHTTHDFVQHDLIRSGKPHFCHLAARFDRSHVFREFGYYYVFAPSSALSLTRAIANRIFPMPEEGFRICADAFVAQMATALAGVHMIDKTLGIYRIHESNLWARRKIRKNDRELTCSYALDMVNRKLFSYGLPPVPFHNLLMRHRLLKEVMQIEKGRTYYIYGTGSMAESLADIIEHENGTTLAFVDSSPARWGSRFLDQPVISPAELATRAVGSDRILIGSSFVEPILKTLAEHGIGTERVLYWCGFLSPMQHNEPT